MNSLSLDISNAAVSESQLAAMTVEADESLGKVLQATGAGSDFLGWVRLPSETLKSDLVDRICDTASRLRSSCDTLTYNHIASYQQVKLGTLARLPAQAVRKAGMTSNQHGPYVRGDTRVTMGGTAGSQAATPSGTRNPLSVRIGVCNPTP